MLVKPRILPNYLEYMLLDENMKRAKDNEI